jgi:hypothetical protein
MCATASIAKGTPMLYAPLVLLFAPRREGIRSLGLAVAAVLAFFVANVLLFPQLTVSWLRVASQTAFDPGGFHEPTLYKIGLPGGVVAAIAVIIAVMSLVAIRRTNNTDDASHFFIVAMTLLLPRLKDYGFLVLIAPFGHFLALTWNTAHRWIAPASLLLSVLMTARPDNPNAVWSDFRPTLFLALVWAVWTGVLLLRTPRLSGVAAPN